MQRLSFLKLALCSALLATGLAANAQVTRIRFSHAGPETASQHQAALEFARLVKERSKGQLEVQVYPSSQLGNDSTTLGAVRGGTIDMMMAGSVNFAGLTPKMGALDLPFLFTGPAHAYKVLDGAVGIRETLPRIALVAIARPEYVPMRVTGIRSSFDRKLPSTNSSLPCRTIRRRRVTSSRMAGKRAVRTTHRKRPTTPPTTR